MLLSSCIITTAGLAGALSPVAVVVWTPSLVALTLLPVLLGAGGVGYYLRCGLSTRWMFEQALRHYTQVTDDYEVAELHACLIPEDKTRGARVMVHYHWFRNEYKSLTRSWQDFGSPRGAQWFEPGVLQRVRDIKRRSATLKSTGDIIASNATFLNLSSSWERLWRQGQQPILHKLNLLLGQYQWIDSCVFTPHGMVGIRELVRTHHQRPSKMTAELSAGLLQPSAAPDELTWIGADVCRSANAPAQTVAGANAPLGPPDLDVQHWMYTSEDLDVIEAGGDVGSLYDADACAVVGTDIGPYAPRRREFLGDGTFPGVWYSARLHVKSLVPRIPETNTTDGYLRSEYGTE